MAISTFQSDLTGLVHEGWTLEDIVIEAAEANLGLSIEATSDESKPLLEPERVAQLKEIPDVLPSYTYRSTEGADLQASNNMWKDSTIWLIRKHL